MPLTLVHIEEREIILYSRWQPLLLLPLDVPAIEERGGESFMNHLKRGRGKVSGIKAPKCH